MMSITFKQNHYCYLNSLSGQFKLNQNPWDFLPKAQEMDQLYFTFPWSDQSWKGVLPGDNNYGFFVLAQEQELVAFALFLAPPQEDFAHLLKLMVAPSLRLNGLGQFFLTKCIEDWKNNLKKEIYLEVQEGNLAACSLYKKIGFDILCLKKNFYGNERNAFAMKLSF